MIRADLLEFARQNLVETYACLAGATLGGRVERCEHFIRSFGPAEIAYCNFVAGFEGVTHDELLALRAELTGRTAWLLVSDGDTPIGLGARLEQLGFRKRQQLVHMGSTAQPDPPNQVERLVDGAKRREAADLMARVFFQRQTPAARKALVHATLGTGYPILGLYDDGLAGAAMTTFGRNEAGLYNLCVEPARQGRGYGTALVTAVQAFAGSNGRPVVLQCERNLVAWYRRQGFESLGTVTAYGL